VRAFLIGGGKSINETPIEKLHDEVTFGMNQIGLLYSETDWRPTYYLFFENVGSGRPDHGVDFNSYVPYVAREMESGRRCFISEHLQPGLMEYTRYRLFQNVLYVPYRCPHMKLDVTYPGRPYAWHLPNLCHYGGTMNIAIQLAFLMGYDPIYLLGCDLGYIPITSETTEDPNHFHPDYWTWTDHGIRSMDKTLESMHINAKKEVEYHGRSIYNATVGGELEVYERVDIHEVLKE